MQLAFPTARFARGFSCVEGTRIVDPQLSRGRPTMVICGSDSSAKLKVTEILERLGWGVLYIEEGAGRARDRAAVPVVAHLGFPRAAPRPLLQTAEGLGSSVVPRGFLTGQTVLHSPTQFTCSEVAPDRCDHR